MKRALPWLRNRREPALAATVEIRGRKVVIREKRLDDVADDYAWRTDEELSRLDATQPLRMSFSDFARFSREEILFSSPASKRLAIDTFDGLHIGNCMYYDIDLRRGEAELGIMIGNRDYWDMGYGTDSVDALLEHIFNTTTLDRVYLHTLDWNLRAQRSFAKSGFREVKKVRRSGLDFLRMDIRREDWDSRHNGAGTEPGPGEPGPAGIE